MPDYSFGKKYLVQRRDGSVPAWPWFVLGGADPYAAEAIRHYAGLIEQDPLAVPLRFPTEAARRTYVDSLMALVQEMERFAGEQVRPLVQEPDVEPRPEVLRQFGLEPRCPACEGAGRRSGIRCAVCEGEGL